MVKKYLKFNKTRKNMKIIDRADKSRKYFKKIKQGCTNEVYLVGHISYFIQSKSEPESDTSITVVVSSFLLMTFGVSSFLFTPFGCDTDIIRGFLIFVRLPGNI